tara:strand:- start:1201 stop:1602 length:402 start_codon:yes stop_codon:yes gene_type:complete
MENDIEKFCEHILPYLDDYQDNLNYIISLMIRDIRTNDLIYSNNLKKWYEYNLFLKKWEDFDFNDIINQISTFDKFFNEHLRTYINQSKLNKNNKLYLLRLIKNIISFIKNNLYDKDKIYNDCSQLFSVDKLV